MYSHDNDETVPSLNRAYRHIDDLVESLSELLTVPELCAEPDEVFDHTREVMAKARTVRSAVLDELSSPL